MRREKLSDWPIRSRHACNFNPHRSCPHILALPRKSICIQSETSIAIRTGKYIRHMSDSPSTHQGASRDDAHPFMGYPVRNCTSVVHVVDPHMHRNIPRFLLCRVISHGSKYKRALGLARRNNGRLRAQSCPVGILSCTSYRMVVQYEMSLLEQERGHSLSHYARGLVNGRPCWARPLSGA